MERLLAYQDREATVRLAAGDRSEILRLRRRVDPRAGARVPPSHPALSGRRERQHGELLYRVEGAVRLQANGRSGLDVSVSHRPGHRERPDRRHADLREPLSRWLARNPRAAARQHVRERARLLLAFSTNRWHSNAPSRRSFLGRHLPPWHCPAPRSAPGCWIARCSRPSSASEASSVLLVLGIPPPVQGPRGHFARPSSRSFPISSGRHDERTGRIAKDAFSLTSKDCHQCRVRIHDRLRMAALRRRVDSTTTTSASRPLFNDRVDGGLPPVPTGLEIPEGNKPFFVGHAFGTLNYICLPSATCAGREGLDARSVRRPICSIVTPGRSRRISSARIR